MSSFRFVCLAAAFFAGCKPGTAAIGTKPTTPTVTVQGPTTTGTTPVGTTPDTTPTTTGTETTPTGTEPFAATFAAETYGAAVALRSNVPWETAACLALGLPDAPCRDDDADGLTDAWEDGALDRLRPAVALHEDEPWVGDGNAVLAMIGRVAPDFASGLVHVHVMIAWQEQYNRCGLGGHDGDSERVVIALRPLPADGPGDAAFVAAYTGAYESSFVRNETYIYEGAELADLTFEINPVDGQPRWKVYAALQNHSTYGTIDHCEAPSPLPIDCAEDACSDGASNPQQLVRLPVVVNAGEANGPRATDLTLLGFPNEEAWTDQQFCGGQGRGFFCDASVRTMLLDNPF